MVVTVRPAVEKHESGGLQGIAAALVLGGGVAGAAVGLTGGYLLDLQPAWIVATLAGFAGLVVGTLVQARHQKRVRELETAVVTAAGNGYLTRVQRRGDEYDGLATGINGLLSRMTDLSVQTIDKERELRWTQETLALKGDLNRTNEQLQRRLRQQELLADLTETFTSTLDIDEVLSTVCDRVAKWLAIDEVAIVLNEPGSAALVVAAASGIPDYERIAGLTFEIGVGVTGVVWNEQPVVYVPDLSKDERYLGWGGAHAHETGSMVVLRMAFRDEKIGLLDCVRLETGGFSEDEVQMLQIVADQAAIAVRNAGLYRQILDLATVDELTGILNRRRLMEHFADEWARGERFGEWLAALILDIDHFKAYNDTHGHLVGDEVLRQVAQALAASVRQVDVVGRYGGEEFVVLLPRCPPEQAYRVGDKLRRLVESLRVESETDIAPPTISVGVACWKPAEAAEGLKPIDLLRSADGALMEAKAAGRNRVVLAEPPSPG